MIRLAVLLMLMAVSGCATVEPEVASGVGGLVVMPPVSTMWIDRSEAVDRLAGQYSEAPVAMGLSSTGGVIELFTSADGATWTLVLTMPSGLSRLVAHGEGWVSVPGLSTINGREM